MTESMAQEIGQLVEMAAKLEQHMAGIGAEIQSVKGDGARIAAEFEERMGNLEQNYYGRLDQLAAGVHSAEKALEALATRRMPPATTPRDGLIRALACYEDLREAIDAFGELCLDRYVLAHPDAGGRDIASPAAAPLLALAAASVHFERMKEHFVALAQAIGESESFNFADGDRAAPMT